MFSPTGEFKQGDFVLFDRDWSCTIVVLFSIMAHHSPKLCGMARGGFCMADHFVALQFFSHCFAHKIAKAHIDHGGRRGRTVDC